MTEFTAVLFGGGISLIINFGSIVYQNRKRKQRERENDQKVWYRDVLRVCRSLERVSYRVDPIADVPIGRDGFQSDDPVINQIDDLLDELEEMADRRPEALEGGAINKRISKIEAWHKRSSEDELMAGIDVKQRVIDDSRYIKNIAEEEIPD